MSAKRIVPLVICAVVLSALAVTQPGYPYIVTTPKQPTEGESVVTIEDMAAGAYTVMDGDDEIGVFRVGNGCTIGGTVRNDPFPIKMGIFPLPDVKVCLEAPLVYAVNGIEYGTMDMLPYYWTDSVRTNEKGEFEFADVPVGTYRLSFLPNSKAYSSTTRDIYLKRDTTLTVGLVPWDAAASLDGKVYTAVCPDNPRMGMPCVLEPVPECTVTVVYSTIPAEYLPWDLSMIPAGLYAFTGMTDENGEYVIDEMGIDRNDLPVTVTARKAGFVSVLKEATLSNTMTATVDFLLEEQFANSATVQVDDLLFTVATEKKSYAPGEYMRVKYTVSNQGDMVRFGPLSGACRFDMVLTDPDGDVVYDYMEGRACTKDATWIELGRGESREFAFPLYRIADDYNGLTVAAQIVGYDETAASVDVTVNLLTAISPDARQAGTAQRLIYSPRQGRLVLRLDRSRRVSLSAHMLNGREIGELSFERFLKAGTHTFCIGRHQLGNGVMLVRIKGTDFQETKRIGLVAR